jgi:hypothetical protein
VSVTSSPLNEGTVCLIESAVWLTHCGGTGKTSALNPFCLIYHSPEKLDLSGKLLLKRKLKNDQQHSFKIYKILDDKYGVYFKKFN